MKNTKTMPVISADYVWVSYSQDAWSIRSKTRIIKTDKEIIDLSVFPGWNFDGSSTGQAPTENSEIILMPCAFYNNPFTLSKNNVSKTPGYIVLCELFNGDMTKHSDNTRRDADKLFKLFSREEPWFGLEQEFFIADTDTDRILGWGENPPGIQGPYYCSVGSNKTFGGRAVVNTAVDYMLAAGLNVSGANAEVAPGQWEYQIGPCEGIDAGDQLWISRWILMRVGELCNVRIVFHPKPLSGDWNGSGCHCNFSTKTMRTRDNNGALQLAVKKLSEKHHEHILVYGKYNQMRLTGSHETSSIAKFTSGIGDRSVSVRIPKECARNGFGYIEDRRPAANCNPWLVTSQIFKTVCLSTV